MSDGVTQLPDGVSFVVPVRNGERTLDAALTAILAQDDAERPFELLVIDDGSNDGSLQIMERFGTDPRVRLLHGEGRGAASAVNLGVRMAGHPFICQVDQDVIIEPGWLALLLAELEDPQVAAAQGYYRSEPDASLWARLAGYDLELRYAAIRGRYTDQVCTGNAVYRAAALHAVGLFDERFGYGYDNDLSYRLAAAGYRLVFNREARSIHRWRRSLGPYLVQQYGVGYGRLDLVAKHRRRVSGDQVSGLGMILHVPLMLAVLVLAVAGVAWQPAALVSAMLLAGMAGERLVAGVRAARRFADPAGLLLAPVHLLRDLSWVLALLVGCARRLCRRPRQPRHSMRVQG